MMDALIIDSFAGGGGASLGIAWALGRGPDIAINHSEQAIACHAANHPETIHLTEDIWKSAPRKVTKGRQVGLLWASPDCKHFSRAKGAKPFEKHIRSLAWVVVRWAVEVRPRIIVLENVREFEDWGPLLPRWRCQACDWKGTEGQTTLSRSRRRCPRCESLRIRVTEELVPDPARRGLTFRRFVGRLKARGYAVQWRTLNAADFGAPTHRRRLFLIARCDGAPIAWPEPTHGDPAKLADAPLFAEPLQPWRTAAECIDWTITCPSIFDRKRPLAEATMKRIALGVKRYVLHNPRPFLVRLAHLLIVPTLVQTGYGERPARVKCKGCGWGAKGRRESPTCPHCGAPAGLVTIEGQAPRVPGLEKPLGCCVDGQKHAVVAAFIAKHVGGTVGVRADTPLPTTTERGTQNQLIAANLVHFNHGNKQWNGVEEPLRTITTGNHAFLVYSFLTKHFRAAIGCPATERDRCGLVCVTIEGEPFIVVDIGMRMLTPRELARCQGFPDTYKLPGEQLPGTKSAAVAMIGNSVCPPVAEAVCRANCGSLAAEVCA